MYFRQLDLEVFFYTRQCITFLYKSAISGRRRADIDVLKRKKTLF